MRAYDVKITGIVNITADSFSDGGRHLAAADAIAHALDLARAGADVVELGAAASNPEALSVDSDEEIARLAPVLDEILPRGIIVSVDTCSPPTQLYCARRGVSMLNDIRGFPRPQIYGELAANACQLVIMHSVGEGTRAPRIATDPQTVAEGMMEFFEERIARLAAAGIGRERLILDPGMGLFLGTNVETSLRVLGQLPALRRRFALPIMISVSRKSFLGELTGRALHERGPATLAAELWAADHGVDYVRTHDVRALHDAFVVLRAIEKEANGR